MKKKKIIQNSLLALLLIWYGLFFAHQSDLTTADLGRHIKNGELALKGQFNILDQNFYSYTQPDFPVVNHHWGGGIIFFLIEKIFGFTGLGIFYLILSLIIFFLFFRVSEKESGFWITFLVSLPLIPLMAARTEIRPEVFSYLLIALFFSILWHWNRDKLENKYLYLLPFLMILWVNTHIYFVFGLGLIGLFLFDKIIFLSREGIKKIKKLGLILGLTFLASLINPFFIKGLIYPFNIFKNYGYRIVENQSVWFLENLGIIQNPNLVLFKIIFSVLVLSFLILWLRKKFNLIYLILAILFSTLAWLAIRNFLLFGLFALPIISYNLKGIGLKINLKKKEYCISFIFLSLAIFLITFLNYQTKLPFEGKVFGFGLLKGNNGSAQFFKENQIQGPIFNNYDIGGY